MGQTNPPRARRLGAVTPLLRLDRQADTPLFRQLYLELRSAILTGRLAGGSRLPPSRDLAADVGVARATVVLAYEQLLVEGYLEARGAAGTFVTALPLRGRARGTPAKGHPPAMSPAPPSPRSTPDRPVPFRVGEPALDLFPVDIWARLYARHARRGARDFLGYGHANGFPPLRRAVAEYVSAARGVRADPGQVILVRGAQQAVDLIARTVFRPGDRVWYEDPGYLAAAAILRLAGTSLVPVPVDAQGLRVDVGENSAADAKGVHVAPSHQFPMGSALSLERRLALLAWASRARAWVIEDDYDSEFRYPGHPLPALQGLDAAGRVIYVGTFSKTVFPALRLGYLIAPPDLVDRLTHAAAQVDHLAPTLEQAVLTDFIEEGHFTRHVRRMRKAYAERQQALISAVEREMAGLLRIEPADAGMHVIGWLPPGSDDAAVSSRALELGVEVPALSRYRLRAPLPPGLLLGFAALRPTAMTTALRKLRKAIEGGPAQ